MALPAAVIGALKVALKKAAEQTAKTIIAETAKGATAQAVKQAAAQAVREVGKRAMTDAQAAILNRLKSAPSKVLWDVASKELGLPVKEIRTIVKLFKQSPKMADLAKGEKFREMAVKSLKKQLDLKGTDRIKDIMRKAKEWRAKEDKKNGVKPNYNRAVLNALKAIEIDIINKIMGITGFVNQQRVKQKYKLNIVKQFDANTKYSRDCLDALTVIDEELEDDLEYYTQGEGGDILIADVDGKYNVYSKETILAMLDGIEQDVAAALTLTEKE